MEFCISDISEEELSPEEMETLIRMFMRTQSRYISDFLTGIAGIEKSDLSIEKPAELNKRTA